MGAKMTQEERLLYLIEEFKADSVQHKELQTPEDTEGKRRILRSLMNNCISKKLDEMALTVQDEYMRESIRWKEIVQIHTSCSEKSVPVSLTVPRNASCCFFSFCSSFDDFHLSSTKKNDILKLR